MSQEATTTSPSEPLPRVTQILKDSGLVDFASMAWFSEEVMDKGSKLHQALHYLDENDLEFSTVSDQIVSRMRQYQKFKDDVRPGILAVEEEVRNEPLQYAGRLDRRVKINGREGILDIKGPGRFPWQAIQLSLYAGCFARPLARWTLHLDDEQYRLVEHRGRHDWEVAKAAITLAAWRRSDGHAG